MTDEQKRIVEQVLQEAFRRGRRDERLRIARGLRLTADEMEAAGFMAPPWQVLEELARHLEAMS